jgi:hypothetical protein
MQLLGDEYARPTALIYRTTSTLLHAELNFARLEGADQELVAEVRNLAFPFF